MKKYLNPKLFLLLIVLLAGFLRLYQLGSNPPGLNWDEAAWGYNAYSLGIDGRDEFGKFLPWKFLESYGDYKPPVYAYLDILPVKILGLDAFATRVPSAILGTLTVLLTYFLVKEIFYKNRGDPKWERIALTSAFFLAISPWHIMLSRGAFEANASTFFIVLGILSFLISVNRKQWFLLLSAFSFSLSFYTFNTARIFVPLLVLFMGFTNRKTLIANYKSTIVAVILGAIIVLPLVPFLVSPQAKIRFEEVNIFSDPGVVAMSNQEIVNDHGALWSHVLHNRRVLYGLSFLKHYSDNLDPKFLFITGDGNPRFSTQDIGELYLIDLPFLLFGIYMLFKKKEGSYLLIPVWFLLGIIPAATARETPHALRIETVIPTLQILTAIGLVELCARLRKHGNKIYATVIFILLLSLFYFIHGYVNHYAREYASEWQYSYKDAVSYVDQAGSNYKNIIVTTQLGRPYIYFLLYNRYDPVKFRQSAQISREALGFVHVNAFDKYKFEDSIDTAKLNASDLYLDIPANVPKDVKVVKNFYLPDGTLSLIAYETNR